MTLSVDFMSTCPHQLFVMKLPGFSFPDTVFGLKMGLSTSLCWNALYARNCSIIRDS